MPTKKILILLLFLSAAFFGGFGTHLYMQYGFSGGTTAAFGAAILKAFLGAMHLWELKRDKL